MEEKKERLFYRGIPNWDRFGMNFYEKSGEDASSDKIEEVAKLLNTETTFIDKNNYQHEIIAAEISDNPNIVAYVVSKAKELKYVDVEFTFIVEELGKRRNSWTIETYNPFFGCDVRLLKWYNNIAILVYREKHYTYICCFGLDISARFKKLSDNWVLVDSIIYYRKYSDALTYRLLLPHLSDLTPLSLQEIEQLNIIF